MAEKVKEKETQKMSVEERLFAIHELQTVKSDIDKIKTLRGELPLEVQDLEDEIAGLETRISNYQEDIKNLTASITQKKNEIKQSEELIKKYEDQQMNVRNNREFDALSKEIEFQKLEIELSEKKIREFTDEKGRKEEMVESSSTLLDERKKDLEHKKKELDDIVGETQKEEERLKKKSEEIEKNVEPRLLNAFTRIRKNARNGLAVVAVARDSCGGCFNKIPPQRQLDIRSRKKIIVCEYCGRILVDNEMAAQEETK